MASKTIPLGLCLFAVALAAFGQAHESTGLRATIEKSEVRIEGVTKGGEVELLSVWREQLLNGPYASQTNIEETLKDEDLDGVVTYEAERPIPTLSLWVAVDTTTGEAAITSPSGFAVRKMSGREAAEFRGARVHLKRRQAEILVVRPGVAAWRGRAHDADVTDDDGVPNQSVALSLDVLDGPREPGPAFRAGDTLIAIDPVEMDVLAVRLD